MKRRLLFQLLPYLIVATGWGIIGNLYAEFQFTRGGRSFIYDRLHNGTHCEFGAGLPAHDSWFCRGYRDEAVLEAIKSF